MKNILFLTDTWRPFPTANVVCIQNIIGKLKTKSVFVSAFAGDRDVQNSSRKNGVEINEIAPTLERKLFYYADRNGGKNKNLAKWARIIAGILAKGKKLIIILAYPKQTPIFCRRWGKQAIKIIDVKHIDTIVSVAAPSEALWAGEYIKRRRPHIRWIIYLIDGGSDLEKSEGLYGLKKMLQTKYMKEMKRLIDLADEIVIMKCHELHYRSKYFTLVQSKIKILDVPLLMGNSNPYSCDLENSQLINIFEDGSEHWVYTGTLNYSYYNPKAVCDFFLNYSKEKNAKLHFWGRGPATGYLYEIQNQAPDKIKYHGLLAHEQISYILKRADVLMFFRSGAMSSICGKYFEYLAYQKPIVYFTTEDMDVNVPYVKKYEAGCVVNMRWNMKKQIDTVNIKLKNIKLPSLQKIRECFYLNTPEAAAAIVFNESIEVDSNNNVPS